MTGEDWRMNLCRSIEGPAMRFGALFFGFSWIYWLRRIYYEVNRTLPEKQKMKEWTRWESIPREIHRVWDEHVRLFPECRNRITAAFSLLLAFLVPIAALTWCLLVLDPVP
jgi:hypothetical protein